MSTDTFLCDTFIAEYIISENATASYRKAFFALRNYHCTYNTAATEGKLLLKKPQVQAEIKAAREVIRKRGRASAEKVVRELGKIAFCDPDDIIDFSDPDNPRLKRREDIPAAARQVIQEVSRNQFGVKIKLADKLGALDKIARILGLYNDLPPLENLLARLPPDIRETVRAALAVSVHEGGNPVVPEPIPKHISAITRPDQIGPITSDEDGGLES
jgi:phage terminase small subunit